MLKINSVRHVISAYRGFLLQHLVLPAVLLFLIGAMMAFLPFAAAQETVTVPVGTPCFLQEDVGVNIFERCGLGDDWLAGITIGWDWVLGGYFSLALICILCLITYQKYQKAIYPLAIGIMYLPVSYTVLPPQFFTIAILLVGVLFGIYIWFTFVRQTRDF